MRYITLLISIAVLFTLTMIAFATQDSSGKENKSFFVKEKSNEPEKQADLNPEFQQVFSDAVNQFNAKAYDEAIILLTKVINAYPGYIPAYEKRGLAYMDKGKITKGTLSKTEITYNKSIYEYQKAVKNFSKIIQLDPNLDYAYYYRGVSYVELDYYASLAMDDLNVYINNFKNETADAFYYRGVANLQRGFLPEAEVDLKKAIDMDPKHADAYASIMKAFVIGENYSDAISYFGMLIKRYPDNALPWYYQGLTYLQQEDFQKAIADFDKAISIFPDYVDARNMKNEAIRDSNR
jgi:tetratricopeptide (TPR) repeat protein